MRKEVSRKILNLALAAGVAAMCAAGAASVCADETWLGGEYDEDWDDYDEDDYDYDEDDYDYDEDDFAGYDEDDYNYEDEEDDGSSEGVPGGVHLGPSTEELSETTGRDIDGIISHLKNLPDDYDALVDAGVVVSGSGGVANFEKWASFVRNAASGNAASVDVASLTAEGQAVIDHVDFNGSNFVDVHDNSRDRYYLGSSYIVRTYKYVLGFDENGRTVLIASQDEGGAISADAVDAEDSWQAAALAAVPYESLGALENGIDEDVTGETTPVILFDHMAALSEYGIE